MFHRTRKKFQNNNNNKLQHIINLKTDKEIPQNQDK